MKNLAPAIAALLTLGPLALAAASTPVSGQVGTETVQVAVRRIADPRALDRRLSAAALEACGAASTSLAEVRAATAASPCYATALARARIAADTATASTEASTGRP